jgi:hypothetical protein
MILDMYMGVFGGMSKVIDDLIFKELGEEVDNEITMIRGLNEVRG